MAPSHMTPQTSRRTGHEAILRTDLTTTQDDPETEAAGSSTDVRAKRVGDQEYERFFDDT